MNCLVDIDPKIKGDHSKLFDEPVVVLVNEFTEKSVKQFRDDMSKAQRTGQSIIPVLIDSYGGEAYSLLGMISVIRHSSVPVATIVDAKAMSCGAILFSFGAKGHRYMSEDATLMIHHVSLEAWGKIQDVEASAAQGRLLNDKVYRMMAENCDRETNYFVDLVEKQKKGADWYLTAQEAKEHGLASKLRVPNFKTKVVVETTFE